MRLLPAFPQEVLPPVMEAEPVNNLETYAFECERLSAKLRGDRIALLDWLEDCYGAAEDLTASDAAALASLVRARRDTLSELIKVDDVMLLQLLQR